MTTPARPEGAFHRAPRPLIGWAGVVLIVICVVFIAAIAAAIAVGFWLTAARGQPVPDLTGGLAVLLPAVATAWGMVAQWMHTRSRERRDEIAFGGAPRPPFDPSPQSGDVPGGGLVNNEAIQ